MQPSIYFPQMLASQVLEGGIVGLGLQKCLPTETELVSPITGATLTIADNSNEPTQPTDDPLPSSNRGRSIRERLLTPLYGAIRLALRSCWWFHAYIFFTSPVQVDYGEGVSTHFSLAMFHGAPIYTCLLYTSRCV